MRKQDKSESRSKSPMNKRNGSKLVNSSSYAKQSTLKGTRDKSPNDRYSSYGRDQNTTYGTASKRYDSANSSSKSPNKTAMVSRISGSSHAVGSSTLKASSRLPQQSAAQGAPLTRSYNYLSNFGSAFKKNLAA